MRVLIADDERTTAAIVARAFQRWSLDVTVVHDGGSAWDVLKGEDAPRFAILDWMMPVMDGVEICRRLREDPATSGVYVMLLTGRDSRADVVAGLDAGADDYLVKPCDSEELRARIQVGLRLLKLQEHLSERVAELQDALTRVKQLSGLLPICSYCKRIRSDGNYWQQVESYVSQHSDAQFSHGICPDCYTNVWAQIQAETSDA
jgi:sigma-B regulation protein RsbU (phosphoserine phosphatase)